MCSKTPPTVFLPFLWNVVAVNPRRALTFDLDGERLIDMEEPTDPAWEKCDRVTRSLRIGHR